MIDNVNINRIVDMQNVNDLWLSVTCDKTMKYNSLWYNKYVEGADGKIHWGEWGNLGWLMVYRSFYDIILLCK